MIKVLSPSKFKKVECPDCGAVLQYEQSDVKFTPLVAQPLQQQRQSIDCPECKHEIVLKATR